MAQNYFGVNVGEHKQDVAVGTSTNSTDVEVRVDLAKATTREQALLAVDAIVSAMFEKGYPAA